MNTDIRLNIDVLSSMRIKKLIRRKGHAGFYSLISIWLFAAKHRPEGVLYDLDNEDIMDVASTKDETFIHTLVEIGLLDFDGTAYAIHNWPKHNPWCVGSEKRAETARKAAEVRWSKHTIKDGNKTK